MSNMCSLLSVYMPMYHVLHRYQTYKVRSLTVTLTSKGEWVNLFLLWIILTLPFFRIVRVAETIGIKIELYGESGIGWLLHAMHVHDHVLSCRTDAVYISLAENLSCVWNDTAITFFLNIWKIYLIT